MKLLKTIAALSLIPTTSFAIGLLDKGADLYDTSSFRHSMQGNGFAVVKGSCCTGTLIDPYWVITANHVSSSRWSVNKYEEKTEGNYTLVAQQKTTLDMFNDPWGEVKWIIKDKNGKNRDLAIFKLNKPFDIIKPAEIYDFRKFGYDLGGKLGYVPNRSGGQQIVGSFTHRADKDYKTWDKAGWLDVSYTGLPHTKYESDIASGDSGSGIYVEHNDKIYLVGAMAMTFSVGSRKTGQSGISASHYLEQIEKIMADNAYIKSLPLPEWEGETSSLQEVFHSSPYFTNSVEESFESMVGDKYRISFDARYTVKYDIEVEGRKIAYDRTQNDEVLYTELVSTDGELNIKLTNKNDIKDGQKNPADFSGIYIHKL